MSTVKTLRVCLSKDLPSWESRSSDYLYFAYDKLFLYFGQTMVSDNFVIASSIPEAQIDGLIYILDTDGSVHRKIDYVDTVIATIEAEEQIAILKKAGTMYYINNNHRYLDEQTRTLTLPFNDGKYELAVAAKNDQVYDDNTILKFNSTSNRFEVYGEESEEFIDFSKPFRGGTTSSASVTVDGPRITANVRVSKVLGNLLKASASGLYLKADSAIDKDEFNEWATDVADMKKHAQDLIDNIESQMEYIESLITPEAIEQLVHEQVETEFPTIQTAIDNYAEIVKTLDKIEAEVIEYADSTISTAKDSVENKVVEYSSWVELDTSASTYTHEIDYYKKAEDWYYPTLHGDEIRTIISAAVAQYIADAGVLSDTDIKIIITAAINKFMQHDDED